LIGDRRSVEIPVGDEPAFLARVQRDAVGIERVAAFREFLQVGNAVAIGIGLVGIGAGVVNRDQEAPPGVSALNPASTMLSASFSPTTSSAVSSSKFQ